MSRPVNFDAIRTLSRKVWTSRRSGGVVDFYIDGAAGSDLNSGLSSSSALQTLGAIYDRMADYPSNGHRAIVHLAGGPGGTVQTYNTERSLWVGGGEYLFCSMQFRGPQQMVRATPATGPSTAALNNPTPVTQVGRRSRFNFSTANPGWTVDDFAGRYFIRVTRGTVKVIFECPISQNSANQIFIDDNGDTAGNNDVLSTDTVEIVEPGAAIAGDPTQPFITPLYIDGQASILPVITVLGLDNTEGYTFERITFPSNPTIMNGAWGQLFDRCSFRGGLAMTGGRFQFVNCGFRGVDAEITGGSSLVATLVPRSDGIGDPIDTGPTVYITGYSSEIGFGGTVQGSGIVPDGCAVRIIQALTLRNADFSFYGAALYAEGGGTRVLITGPLFGDCTNGPAIFAAMGAQVRIDVSKTAFTGDANGDLALETGAKIFFGANNNQFSDPNTWNKNFYRGNLASGDPSRISSP